MRNRVKRFWAFVLAVSFCVVFSANAYAIQLRYINELVAMNEVGISGGKATMYSDVVCSSDVTKVVMTHVLQKKSGSTFSNVRNTTFTRTFLNNHAPDMEDVVNCCSATRFLRNADRINEKNEAGKITSQPRSFWPRSRHCPAADRTILRPTRIRYTRRKWPASAGSCHNGITSPYRS